MDELRAAVLFAAREVMTDDIRNGVLDLRFRIDAEDGAGTIVQALPFPEALQIISS